MLIAGRYQLQDPIGRGAMGEVWRAYDETLGRPVAVKLLLPQDSDPTAASRFRLEAQTAGRLHHPYVVGVLDFGAQEDRLFLVMELVDGDSLARVLADAGPQPAERVARIASQAAAGLAAAHQQGIVHRDIKPANLLLDADGTLKIGDFGIARFLDDPAAALTATGQIVGTSLYLAPERALGRPAGPASDVYSLGCVLYQLLTGRPPFQADTPIAILHQHLDATPVPPRQLGAELPPAFESYLLGLLAKQPEHRPSAAQVADWFAAGAWQGRPEPLPATAPTPTAPTPAAPQPTRVGETGPATTYMLPSLPRSGARRRSRPGSREVLMRPRVMGTAAAVALFLAAMVAGMLWFSPDHTAAEGSKDSPGTTTPAATTTPTPSPTPSDASATPAAETSPTPVAARTSEKAKDDKRERRRHTDDEGDDGDDGDD
ncbi:serine/threonine-protein kinase [Streptomyces sp. TRM70350]|uniref:serine/threonine-protein kinase n=1 Tax=Streptomyces sp. TRM70350 TaxID=2856165 RepID=UPI001C469404|nr:serine/threonine-protein kinase [Streptomyces sp. TRM70350]MBV7694423.1 serine/threonine protein kinase [Streptomyces sp. TRM70350]